MGHSFKMEEGDIYGKDVECGEDGERTSLGTENKDHSVELGLGQSREPLLFVILRISKSD